MNKTKDNAFIPIKVKPFNVEVARSFAYKLNCGNYQTANFYCSQKAEIPEKEAEKKSEELYAFCRKEVLKSINSYLNENQKSAKPLNKKKELTEIKPVSDKQAKDQSEEFNKKIEQVVEEGREKQAEDKQ